MVLESDFILKSYGQNCQIALKQGCIAVFTLTSGVQEYLFTYKKMVNEQPFAHSPHKFKNKKMEAGRLYV